MITTLDKRKHGYRARIGYTSPMAATEVFPYEFYRMAPPGVTLVLSTMAVLERTADEVDRSYDISLKAAKEIARTKIDLMVLGGVPINLARNTDPEEQIRQVEQDIGVPVATSITAQNNGLQKLGAKKVAIGHPFTQDQNEKFKSYLTRYGYEVTAVRGAEYTGLTIGHMPQNAAFELGRDLKRMAPDTDTIWLPCPHWAMSDMIEPMERELGVGVVGSLPSIVWHALRRCGIDDKIDGFGRLFREF
jgi:maleate isomerase